MQPRADNFTEVLNPIFIEPNTSELSELKEKGYNTLNCALWSEEKEKTFRITKKQESSSIYVPNYELLNKYSDSERFDIKEEKSTAEISINLSPLERGKGFSSTVISKSISYFNIVNNKRIKTTIARIKKKNIASKRSFMKCGFKLKLVKENVEIYNFIF